MLDWNRACEFSQLTDYYRGLIQIRRRFSGLYRNQSENIKKIAFYPVLDSGVVAFLIGGHFLKEDAWSHVFVAYNATDENKKLYLPYGEWRLLADGESSFHYKMESCYKNNIVAAPKSAAILGIPKV